MIKMESSVKSKLEPDESVAKRSVYTSDSHIVWKVLLVLIAVGYVVFSVYEIIELKSSVRNLQTRVDAISSRCIPDQSKGDDVMFSVPMVDGKKENTIKADKDSGSTEVKKSVRQKRGTRRASNTGGSAFVRWGRQTCSQLTSQLYNGFAAGALPLAGHGGSSKLECLPSLPDLTSIAGIQNTTTVISAAKLSSNNRALPCSVCVTNNAPTVMIPGLRSCPFPEWRTEYVGYLMSTPGIPSTYYFSSLNYCVDQNPDSLNDPADSNGMKLTFVQNERCSQAYCRLYRAQAKINCVVCSRLAN